MRGTTRQVMGAPSAPAPRAGAGRWRLPALAVACAAALALPAAAAEAQGGLRVGGHPSRVVAERLEIAIDRQHATTRLLQTHAHDAPEVVEAVYRVRVGDGARLLGFSWWDGDTRVSGEVVAREAAREAHAEARARGGSALAELEAEGALAFRVFPVEPGVPKRTEAVIGQYLFRRGDVVELRFPLATPDARIDVRVSDDRRIADLRSPTHGLRARPDGEGALAVAARPLGAPTELVLRYRVLERPYELAARVHRAPGRDPHLLLSIAMPQEVDPSAVAPKDLTLVLDRSRSMQGQALEGLRAAAAATVRALRPGDRVNVIAFGADVQALFERPAVIGEEARAQALRFVERLEAEGGTDLATALERALVSQHGDRRPAYVLLLTDGRSDPGALLDVAAEDRSETRVFAVGLGAGVARPVLARLTSMRRGAYVFVERPEVLEERVAALVERIDEPVALDLRLEVSGGRLSGRYPRTLPDLFRGDELLVATRVEGAGPLEVRLWSVQSGEPVERTLRVALPRAQSAPWVARAWAGARVDDLLEEIALNGEHQELVDEVVELAVAYDLVSPYTALLAVPAEVPPGADTGVEVAPGLGGAAGAASNRVRLAREGRRAILARAPDAPPAAPVTPAPSGTEQGEAARGDADEEAAGAASRATYEASDAAPGAGGCASCGVAGARRRGGGLAGLWLVGAALAACGMRRRRRR